MKPNRFNALRLTNSAALLGAAALLATPAIHAAERYWDQAGFATAFWNTATNWDADTLPIDGDTVRFGRTLVASPGVAITTGTSRANYSLNIADLKFHNAANLTIQAQNSLTLTLNNITFSSAVNDVVTAPAIIAVPTEVSAGTLTISRSAAVLPGTLGNVTLGSNAIWDLSGLGAAFGGLTITTPLTGAFSITKIGPRALTLTAGGNLFSGGIINRRGSVFTGSFAASGNLGTGPFTFGNENGGLNDAVVSLSLNNGFTSNFTNNIVNNNASAILGNLANLNIGTNGALYTQTLSGNVTTGPNFNPVQVLRVGVNNNSSGTQEGTLVFSGDWTGYSSPGAYGISIGGGGTIRLGSQASIAQTNYQLGGPGASGLNNVFNSNKIILDGAYTVNRRIGFLGEANGMRNSFGTRTAASTTATLVGDATSALEVTDNDGANIFAQNVGSTLAVTGIVTGGVNARIRINDSYTFVTGSTGGTAGSSTVQSPTGTVSFANDANTFAGGVTVVNGTFLANNTAGSATGTGQVNIGAAGAASTAQNGATTATTRVITAVNTATAQTLQIGQGITGTNIPNSTVITGITLGNGTNNSTIVVSNTITTATPNVAFATTASSTAATLGGTGRIAPTGANGLLVSSGSTLRLVDGVIENLEVDLIGTGSATFDTGATFAFELGDSTNSDSIAFTGLDDSALTFNSNVINLAATGSIAGGSHTYTLMTFSPALAVAPTLVLGTLPMGFSGASLNQQVDKIELTVTYTSPYDTFINSFPSITGADKLPTADPDGDGLTNQQEFAFGLAPDSGASVNPIVSPLDKTTGLFIYTRRGPAVSGLAFTHEYSINLTNWIPFTPDSVVSNGGSPVEQITVDVPNALLTNTRLFVRPVAK